MMPKFSHFNKISLFFLFLLILSLLFNGYLLQKNREAYLFLNTLSLNPVDLRRYQKENVKPEDLFIEPHQLKVVMFGDSRIASWKKPNLEGVKFINRGIPAQTTEQTYLRFDDHISYLKPDIIVIQIGLNDLRMLALPPQTRQDTVKNCQENIYRIINKSQGIGAITILTTIFPMGKDEIPWQWQWTWNKKIEIESDLLEVNDYIRSLKDEKNVIILDGYRLLEEQEKLPDKYAKDFLHLNTRGYEVLNQELVNIILSIKK